RRTGREYWLTRATCRQPASPRQPDPSLEAGLFLLDVGLGVRCKGSRRAVRRRVPVSAWSYLNSGSTSLVKTGGNMTRREGVQSWFQGEAARNRGSSNPVRCSLSWDGTVDPLLSAP